MVKSRAVQSILAGVSGGFLLLCSSIAAAHPGVHHDIERVTEELKKQPRRADLLIERGVYLRINSDYPASLADFDEAQRLEPANMDIAAHRGITFAAMNRPRDAERELTRFLDSGRVSAAVLAARADARVKLGQTESAIADLSHALSISPDVDLYIERARLEESLGRLDRAADGLRDGVLALHGPVVLRDRLIDVEIRNKRYQAAIRVIDDQIAATPVPSGWYLRRSEVLKMAGKTTEAQQDRLRALNEADRAISQHPSAIHLMTRARVFVALGRNAEASADLHAALNLSPRMSEAMDLLSTIDKEANQSISTSLTEIRGRQ